MFASIAVALAMAGTMACASARGPAPDDAEPGLFDDPTYVAVSNNNWSDMVLYVLRDGSRFRLGDVTSMTQRRFRIPDGLVSTAARLQLLVTPIGSREQFVTSPILVTPGGTIEWRVENHLPLSSLRVSR